MRSFQFSVFSGRWARLELLEPADVAGDFGEAFGLVQGVAPVVVGQAVEVDILAAESFEMLDRGAEHVAAETLALEARSNGEDVDEGECGVAIKRRAGHSGEFAVGLADEDDLRLKNVVEAGSPTRFPVASVQRADLRVELLLPGDRLKGVEDEGFNRGMISRNGEAGEHRRSEVEGQQWQRNLTACTAHGISNVASDK